MAASQKTEVRLLLRQMEALCRVSELKSFPTDREIRQFGHANVIEFFKDVKTMTDWEGGEQV